MKISPLMNNLNNPLQISSNPYKQGVSAQPESLKAPLSPSFGGKGSKDANLYVRTINKIFHLDEWIPKGLAKFAETKVSKKITELFQNFKSPTARWSDLESFMVTLFYMWNTWKSEKIDEERKVPSMIQNAAVTAVSSTLAFLIDSALDPVINKTTLAYQNLPKNQVPVIKGKVKSAKEFYDSAKLLKSNTIFAITVRFAVPVLMVPAVGAIVKMLNNKKAEAQKQNEQARANNLNTLNNHKPVLNFNSGENKFKSIFA